MQFQLKLFGTHNKRLLEDVSEQRISVVLVTYSDVEKRVEKETQRIGEIFKDDLKRVAKAL